MSCAVLAERARIAREIHDNVGHLLTRSVLQMEALAVTHEDDPALAKELAAVGATLHEALGTVRPACTTCTTRPSIPRPPWPS